MKSTRSSGDNSRAVTSNDSRANSTWASGFARRLYTHAGLTSAPPNPAMTNSLPSIRRQDSGDIRGSPDFAPVVVSSSISPPPNAPTLPSLLRNSSTILALNVLMASGSGRSVMPLQAASTWRLFRSGAIELEQRDDPVGVGLILAEARCDVDD